MVTGRETSGRNSTRVGRAEIMRAVSVLALIALIAALAVDNRQEVSVGWLVGDTEMPLYQVFVATFVVGILAGVIARHRRRHHH